MQVTPTERAAPVFLPSKAVVADLSGQFVGHAAGQRFGGSHQLSPAYFSRRPETVTFPGADETLERRCHGRFSLHVNQTSVFTSAINAAS